MIGREIECAVLATSAAASGCGEIVLSDEFYAYDTKYLNEDGAASRCRPTSRTSLPAHPRHRH
ncbi:D-alanine--D-alanine ligase A [Chromobacterium violaceum]|uniref:D-alanine--D-alanine ligase A n=1 Tax=Chromobacterium violaceum TaxID=536 RepID=A0A3S4IGU2_CHRVL|nr:D-alanine--D-alanine ligase A [Chromobacterium violaceum]